MPAATPHAQPPAGSDVDSERRRRSRYHVAIKHAQRSASCPCRRHGDHFSDSKAARRAARRTSGTSAAPGGCTAGGSCAARGTCRSRRRPAHRRATSSALHSVQPRPGVSAAPRRRRRHRVAPQQPRVLPGTSAPRAAPQARRRLGHRSGRSSLRCARETRGRSEERASSCPARVARTPGRQPQGLHATPRGRAAAGSVRPYRAGPGQIGPAGPGNATANLQPNRCRSHLAQ